MTPCYLGDYYPLTPYSVDEFDWMAWQFDRPDLGEGLVQIFRRKESPFETACFPLHGLDPQAAYRVTDLDAPDKAYEAKGQQLIETGLPVAMKQLPQAKMFSYRRVEKSSR